MNDYITIAFPDRLGKYGALDFVGERLGIEVLESKNKYQRFGNYEFAIMYSRMVPLAVESGMLTGMTGADWLYEYTLGNPNSKLRVIEQLPFGKAKVVAFKDKNTTLANPSRIISPYKNLTCEYIRKKGFRDTEFICAPGETESWVKAGLADLGIDNKNSGETMKQTDLEILDEIYDSCAIIISKEKDINKVKEIWGLI